MSEPMERVPRSPEARPDLRERFKALFAQLAREEEALKSVVSQNQVLEQQLRQSGSPQTRSRSSVCSL